MKKLFGKLAVVFCAAMMLLAVGLFTACGGSKEVTYTITLVTPDGSAYDSAYSSELMIGFCEGAEGTCRMFAIDENGVCTITPDKLNADYTGDYVVKILKNGSNATPRFKTYDDTHETYDATAKNPSITITLEYKDAE